MSCFVVSLGIVSLGIVSLDIVSLDIVSLDIVTVGDSVSIENGIALVIVTSTS